MSDINKLNESLSNWKALGEVNVNDKLQIKDISGRGLGKVTIDKSEALQNVFRSLSKAFSFSPMIADGVNTSKWIGHFQTNTLENLEALETDIQTKSFEELVPLMLSLKEMNNLVRQSNVGLTNLGNTYGDSRVFQGDSSLRESLLLRRDVNELILHKIETQIEKIKMKGVREVFTASVGDVGENTAQKGVTQVQEYVKGEGVAVAKTPFTENGNTVLLPNQFHRDVTRCPHIELNNTVIYSNKNPTAYSVVSVYATLKGALGDSENALMAVMSLTTQGMFADSMGHVMNSSQQELGKQVVAGANPDTLFQYSIKVVKDEVQLTLKNSYMLRGEWGDEEGYMIAKREFKLSLKELQAFDSANPTPLKTIEVKDTYSNVIHDPQAVIDAYPHF